MRPYFVRSRWLFKYLVFIPLIVVVILNVQLISQIKDFNSFYNRRTASINDGSLVSEGQSESSRRIRLVEKSDPIIPKKQADNIKIAFNGEAIVDSSSGSTHEPTTSSDHVTKAKNDQFELDDLKKLIDNLNSNPNIRNRHFIDNLLRSEQLLNIPYTSKEPKIDHSTTTNVPILKLNSHFTDNQLNKTINDSKIEPINITKKILKIISSFNSSQNNSSLSESKLTTTIKSITTTTSSTNKEQPTTKTAYKPPKFLVILVQVHSRLNYLTALIDSLKNTKYIEQTLVIFSHDVYDDKMNKLIKEIDFCATLQIFYPHSIQLYPNKFPGQDPNDCPKSIPKDKALIAKCNNAAHPDSFGNYREAHVVQIKHHWFWKLAYTFEKLNETKNIPNLHVLLLEEDHYLMPDAIHVLRKLTEKILSNIDVVSLAIFDKNKQNLDMNQLNLYAKSIWHTTNHNTGLLISSAQWKMIKDCLNAFCSYDDYNWDWTLQYLSQTCFKLPLVAIYPVSSRVVHIGECGTHHKGSNCDPKESVDKLKNAYNLKKAKFFPDNFTINGVNTGIQQIKRSNGGWSDPRDFQLCKEFIKWDSHFNSTTVTIKL